MKPLNIFLVRHGQSEGNVNKEIYTEKPDYTVELTDKGKQQAQNVGKELAKIISPEEHIQIYCSPLWRTRQTFLEIEKTYKNYHYYEDSRLREQEWSQDMITKSGFDEKAEEYRNSYGHFYYRFREGGESCADVFDRVSDFLNTLFRSFDDSDYPSNVIIISHGMTIRLFLMRFFHVSVEEFESWANPKNCEMFHLELDKITEKYKLLTGLRKHNLTHNYQFNWPEKFKHFDNKIKIIE